MYSVRDYTKAVKRYDPELYAQRDDDGIVSIMRNGKRWQVYDVDGDEIAFLVPSPSHIFALTENWSKTGQPRFWSPDRVLSRLGEIDAWAREDLLAKLEAEEEKHRESSKRHMRNESEAFWLDQRKTFAKATDGILTHSMNRKYSKRSKKGA